MPVPVICVPESAVMAAVVAVMSTVSVLGGLVTVICVSESAAIVPATPPKRTTVAWSRPVPVMVTVLPPTVLPLAGDTRVTAGSVTGDVLPCLVRPAARAVPTIAAAAAAATTMAAMMTALAAPKCLTWERQLRWRRGIRSTVMPSTAGGPPDGHSAASSSAASPRCDRPRSSQSGP